MGDIYHSNGPVSTDHSHKIEELENSKQFQDAIGLIREQMKNNLQWNVFRSFGIICAILSIVLLRFAAIPLILFYHLSSISRYLVKNSLSSICQTKEIVFF